MHSRSHLGVGFELWRNQRVWFWSVINPRGNGSAIGAAITEAEAVCEACTAIEELSALRRRSSASAVHARQRHLAVRLSSVKFDHLGRERLAGVGRQLRPVSNFCV
jgi:hypothetical protein